jgi:PKD repeat protein
VSSFTGIVAFGDGTSAAIGGGSGTYVFPHSYPTNPSMPLAYDVTVSIGQCPPTSIQISVKPCPRSSCRDVTVAYLTQGCVGPGSVATVTATATLTPPQPGCVYQWDFGDGSPNVTTTSPSVTHNYGVGGPQSVAVAVSCPGGCVTVRTTAIPIPNCCPTLDAIDWSVQGDGCADGRGRTATIAFSAETTPPCAPGTYVWHFGDGTSVSNPPCGASHTYSQPGLVTVEVQFTPADGRCATQIVGEPVTVPACSGSNGTGGGGEARVGAER